MLEVERCLRRLQETVNMRQGRISLSCSPTIAATRLPRILSEFEHDYPGIQVFYLNPSIRAVRSPGTEFLDAETGRSAAELSNASAGRGCF